MGTFCILDLTSKAFFRAFFWALFIPATSFANLEENHWVFHFNGNDYKFKRYDIQRGSPRIDLAKISKNFPVVLGVNSKSKMYSFAHKSENRVAMFKLGETTVSGTYGKISISQPPMKQDQKILVPIEFGERVVVPLLTGIAPYIPKAQDMRGEVDIVIDPGHGGNDWGASIPQGKYILKEKDVVLILALRLKEALERLGVKVALTRDRDYYLSLPERSMLANQAKAKLFLSLHYNSHAEQKKIRGYELYVLSMDSSESQSVTAIAKEQQTIPETSLTAVEETLGRMHAEANLESSLAWAQPISKQLRAFMPSFGRPIKMGPFYVLYGAEMPAVLIELGFITSPEDMAYFHEFEKQKAMVLALAKILANRVISLRPKPQTTTKQPKEG